MPSINSYNSALQHHRSYPNQIYEYERAKALLRQSTIEILSKNYTMPNKSDDIGISKKEAQAAEQKYLINNSVFSNSNLTEKEREIQKLALKTSLSFFPDGTYKIAFLDKSQKGHWRDLKEDSKTFISKAKNPEAFELKGKKQGYDVKAFITYDSINRQYLGRIIDNSPNRKNIMFKDLSTEDNPISIVKQEVNDIIDTFDDIYNITIYEE